MHTEQSTELMHYGIRGQKWGIRRFQNPDGSYTEEGKKRYGDGDSHSNRSKSEKKQRSAKSVPESKTWKPEEAENLSDEELNRRNSRLQRERQYRDMTTPQWKKEAKNFTKEALKKILLGTAVATLSGVMAVHYKNDVMPWLKAKGKILVSNLLKAPVPKHAQNGVVGGHQITMDEILKQKS